jgi:hypothetical protein
MKKVKKTRIDIWHTLLAFLIFVFTICYAVASSGQSVQCKAQTAKKTHCLNRAVKGSEVCYIHSKEHQCAFTKSNGERCRKVCKKGKVVCSVHEGRDLSHIPTF